MHSPLTLATDIYCFELWGRLYSSYGGTIMTPWVHRVSYPSIVLQYISDIFLTLLIAGGGIALLMLGILLFG